MERERNVVVTIIKKKNVIIVRLTARASVIGIILPFATMDPILQDEYRNTCCNHRCYDKSGTQLRMEAGKAQNVSVLVCVFVESDFLLSLPLHTQ